MRAREDGGRERAMKRDVERDSPREMERARESVKCREDRIPPDLKSGVLLSSVISHSPLPSPSYWKAATVTKGDGIQLNERIDSGRQSAVKWLEGVRSALGLALSRSQIR